MRAETRIESQSARAAGFARKEPRATACVRLIPLFGRTIEGRNQLKRVKLRDTQPLAPSWGEYLPDFRPLSIGKVLHSEQTLRQRVRSLCPPRCFGPQFLARPVRGKSSESRFCRKGVKPSKPPNSRQTHDSAAEINSKNWRGLPSGFASLEVEIKFGASFPARLFICRRLLLPSMSTTKGASR